jgi:hypothetical protein
MENAPVNSETAFFNFNQAANKHTPTVGSIHKVGRNDHVAFLDQSLPLTSLGNQSDLNMTSSSIAFELANPEPSLFNQHMHTFL